MRTKSPQGERGLLLGSYTGRWLALTALFPLPLVWVLFVLPSVVSTGRWMTLVWVLVATLVCWLLAGAGIFYRAHTRLQIYERCVVWTLPLAAERVFAPREIQRISNLGLANSLRAIRVELTGGREYEIKGFAGLAEISNLLEGSRRAATSPQPPKGPEPLLTWIRWACRCIDDGAVWLNNSPEDCRAMLSADWDVRDRASFLSMHESLQRNSPSAWDDLRALRNLLAASRAGFLDVSETWRGAISVCQRLQRTYPSFETVWLDYLAGIRAWQTLPQDGSCDTANAMVMRVRTLLEKGRSLTPAVAFDIPLTETSA